MRLVSFKYTGHNIDHLVKMLWFLSDHPDGACELKHMAGDIYIVLGGSCVYSTNPMIVPLLYHFPNTYITKDDDLIFAASSFKLTLNANITEEDLKTFQTSNPDVTFSCFPDKDNTIIISVDNGFVILKTSYFYRINDKLVCIAEPSVKKGFFLSIP